MRLNLRQLAQSNIIFRLETDEDRAEFWELFIKNRGCTFNNHRSELLNYAKLWEDESGKLYIDNYKYIMGRDSVLTWREIKEEYMKDSMDLKSIAVRFENVEQRKEIFEKFESKGYKLAPNKISTEGFIGYSEMAKYVCVLTEYGRSGKKIISYEEFIGGNNMKEIINPTNIEQFAENIAKALTNSLKLITDTELNKAKVLLEKNGYTLTSPYIPPTDEEICERIKAMNEEVGYSPDWSKSSDKYFIYFSTFNNRWEVTTNTLNKVLGVTYTTQSIAKQIVAELNEKRFVIV